MTLVTQINQGTSLTSADAEKVLESVCGGRHSREMALQNAP